MDWARRRGEGEKYVALGAPIAGVVGAGADMIVVLVEGVNGGREGEGW